MEEFENREVTEDFSRERRANGTEMFNEPYSQKAVNRLKKMLLTFYRHGETKYYSIHVDGETVLERNSDGRKFDRYLSFVDEETKTVEVRIYKSKSFNCNRYLFIVGKGLSGMGETKEVNMKEEIEKALKAQEKENELTYLRAELEKKERKLKKLKKIVSANEGGFSMGEVKNFMMEGKGLIDAFRGSPTASQLGATPESEVTIEAEESESEEQEIFNQIFANVGKKGIKKALNIMSILSQHPELEEVLIKSLKEKEEGNNGEAQV